MTSEGKYRKIPIISPGAYFWSKGLFEKLSWGGGGGLIHERMFAFSKRYFLFKQL